MILQVIPRSIGSVTVLDMRGKLTFGESCSVLRDTIRELSMAGRQKIVLNFSDVKYWDSAGLGEIVGNFGYLTFHGGYLVLSNLSKEIREQLSISNARDAFQVFDNEAEAIRFLEAASECWRCPLCAGRSSPQPRERDSREDHTCNNASCGAIFSLVRPIEARREGYIEQVRISTFPEEYFEVVTGNPFRLRIIGRLNLFTSSWLEQIWRAVEKNGWPLLVDLRSMTEMSAEGQVTLLRLLSAYQNLSRRAAISLEGVRQRSDCRFPSTAPVYPDDASAISALRLLQTKTPNWPAKMASFGPDSPGKVC